MVYILAVDVAALATVAGTITLAPIVREDWVCLGLLVIAAVAHGEASRGIERIREVISEGSPYTHLQSVWIFAAVLLLPPPLIAVLLVISYTHSWMRVYRRRAVVHRKVFSVATVVLACAAAYAVLAAIYPHHHGEPFATALDGPLGLVAVVAAGALYRLVNYGLVVLVILLTNPDRPARKALGHASDQLMIAGAVGLATGFAVVMTTRPWWTPLLIITVLALHTGLLLPQFRDASRKDAKTGLFDPTFWAELAADELDRARRLDGRLGVLLLDLDLFKRINDRHGHLAGDAVLRAVAEAIRHSVRGHDMVGRYGGEEFAVVLPGLGPEDVLVTAERIRAAIASVTVTAIDLDGMERTIGGLTASVGAAIFPDHGADRTSLLLAADAALYEAKAAGRDCTRIAGRPSSILSRTQIPAHLPTARQPQD
ncbi:GGDEF domain-containing protein [Actinophytocola sp.]|uniref:sensor domain-containing diguanylate cyclase n=1 Tax=Actinophytocola sp. TaxID=1872138 RepID=UPI003D6A9A4C